MPTELCQPRLPHLHSAIHSQSIEGKRPPSQLGYHNEPKASITRGLTREHVDDTEKYTTHDSAAPYSAVKLSMLLTAARLLLLFLTAACHPPRHALTYPCLCSCHPSCPFLSLRRVPRKKCPDPRPPFSAFAQLPPAFCQGRG